LIKILGFGKVLGGLTEVLLISYLTIYAIKFMI